MEKIEINIPDGYEFGSQATHRTKYGSKTIIFWNKKESPKFKVGDKVKITRRPYKNESWNDYWMQEMDDSIGNIMTISIISPDNTLKMKENCYFYPEFVLEKAEPLFYTEEDTPIYEGDKSWRVWLSAGDEVTPMMEYWNYDKNNDSKGYDDIKYFSNEDNAKKYFESLKPKVKFETGKWYFYEKFGFYALYGVLGNNRTDSFVGFNSYGWSDNVANAKNMESDNWILADINKVKELLLNEAKKKYSIGTKVICIDDNDFKGTIDTLPRWNSPFEGIYVKVKEHTLPVYLYTLKGENPNKWAYIPPQTILTLDNGKIIKEGDEFYHVFEEENNWEYNLLGLTAAMGRISNHYYFATEKEAKQFIFNKKVEELKKQYLS